jgi:hypothetical protein
MIDAGQIISTGATGGFWEAALNCGYALVVSSIVLAFMYIWAVFWRNQQMIGSVKLEMTELFVSVVLVSFVLSIAGSLSTINADMFVPSGLIPSDAQNKNIYEITEMYFNATKNNFLGWAETVYEFNMWVDVSASITVYTRPLSVGFTSSPLAGAAGPVKQFLNQSMIALVIAYVINYAQYITYIFALEAFLKYYLPLGLFLRCFTPTRKIGGSLIAVSAALLLAFPILITLSYVIFYSPNGLMIGFNDFVNSQTVKNAFNDFANEFKNNILKPTSFSLWSLIFAPLYIIVVFIKTLFGSIFFVAVGLAGGIVARAFLIGYIMPTFNTLMLIQTARALSKTFGEEIDISSLTRLI